jgi:cobalamin biosynthesis protein CobT
MGVCSSNKSNENKKNNNQVHNNNNKNESQIKKNGKKPDDNNKNQEQKNEVKNNNKQSASIKNQNKKTNTTNNPNNKGDEDLNKNYIRIIIYDNNKEIFSRPYDKETKFSKIFEDIRNRYLNDENYYDLINNKLYYKIDNELINESKEINI